MKVLLVSQPIKVYRPLFKGTKLPRPEGDIKWDVEVKKVKENKETQNDKYFNV